MTDTEQAMWWLLRKSFPESHWRHQAPVRRFVVDFISHRNKLVVEVDGGQHGDRRDRIRTQMIEAEGYRAVRFWNHEVLSNRDGVATAIAEALADRSPPPYPPPSRGRNVKGDDAHG